MIPIFDCHDEAYYRWRDDGIRGATLVHVDAHHDLERGPASGIVHLGNYVRAAIAERIVARIVWVLPRPMWDDPAVRAVAVHDLASLRDGIEAIVAPLNELEGDAAPDAPVLLDIDLDYLFTVAFDRDPARATLDRPWSEVDVVADALSARWPAPRCTTIATSLTGGFTPMRWKHLAVALAARLDGASLDPGWDAAAAAFADADRHLRQGAPALARAAFARALAADAEYRHPFRTLGHLYRQTGRPKEAEAAFREGLALDPGDPWARLGLAMLAIDQDRPEDAIGWAGDASSLDGSIDAWRTRCRAWAALGDVRAALAAGRRVLSLALAGAVPLSVWSANRDRRLVDPDHLLDHARLAALYRRAGETDAARAHQRIADAAGVAAAGPV